MPPLPQPRADPSAPTDLSRTAPPPPRPIPRASRRGYARRTCSAPIPSTWPDWIRPMSAPSPATTPGSPRCARPDRPCCASAPRIPTGRRRHRPSSRSSPTTCRFSWTRSPPRWPVSTQPRGSCCTRGRWSPATRTACSSASAIPPHRRCSRATAAPGGSRGSASRPGRWSPRAANSWNRRCARCCPTSGPPTRTPGRCGTALWPWRPSWMPTRRSDSTRSRSPRPRSCSPGWPTTTGRSSATASTGTARPTPTSRPPAPLKRVWSS
jgi:hypothetical protein